MIRDYTAEQIQAVLDSIIDARIARTGQRRQCPFRWNDPRADLWYREQSAMRRVVRK